MLGCGEAVRHLHDDGRSQKCEYVMVNGETVHQRAGNDCAEYRGNDEGTPGVSRGRAPAYQPGYDGEKSGTRHPSPRNLMHDMFDLRRTKRLAECRVRESRIAFAQNGV